MKIKKKAIMYGVGAALLVIFLNFIVLYLLDFPLMAINIIKQYSILIFLLIIGFGVQVGMLNYHRSSLTCGTTYTSGGISAVSMILCCSHYLLNALPLLGAVAGLSLLASLSDYTVYFLVLGVVSNVFGIGIMMRQINVNKEGKYNE